METPIDLHQPIRRRELAASVGCITREDFCELAGITPVTEQEWRKRRKAPPHIRLGTAVLYPIAGLAEYLQSIVRERGPSNAKGLL
jgi:hypothetical protein